MFVTRPQFQQAMPPGLAPSGSRYWRVVEISLPLPWILVTLRQRLVEGVYEKTVLVADSADMLDLFETRPSQSISRIQVIAHGAISGLGAGWQMQNVRRVWCTVALTDSQQPVLIYEDDAGQLLDEFGTPSKVELERRSLLIELTCREQSPRGEARSRPKTTSSRSRRQGADSGGSFEEASE